MVRVLMVLGANCPHAEHLSHERLQHHQHFSTSTLAPRAPAPLAPQHL
jgi:hypothetical protein